ncbi:MAG: cyclic nucleotide-binding domain-containing protein [Myxococcota bacterium]
MTMDTAKELATSQLFEGLEAEDIAVFANIAQEARYEPQQEVFAPGSAGDALYVIVEGAFAVRMKNDDGEDVDVAQLKEGTYFGEMEVIGGMNRAASIVSVGDGRCYRFDASELLNMLKTKHHLAAHFYREVARELIKRLRTTTRDMGYFKSRAG